MGGMNTTAPQSSPWPNFSWAELACKCGQCGSDSGQNINPELMENIQWLRDVCGPLTVSSAWRCPDHPVERSKATPGTHARGLAIDIRCSGEYAWKVLAAAMAMGCFTGIGISQKGNHGSRFIHLDIETAGNRPWIWSY